MAEDNVDMFVIMFGMASALLSMGMVATNWVIMRNVQGVRRDMKGSIGKVIRRLADVVDDVVDDSERVNGKSKIRR